MIDEKKNAAAIGLNELGQENPEEEIGTPLTNTGARSYLVCDVCNSYRQEILYLEGNNLTIRCLGCGNVSSFPIDSKAVPKEKLKRKNKEKKPISSYLG